MRVERSISVFSYVHVSDPYFSILKNAIGFFDAGLTRANTLDLSTHQLHTSNEFIKQMILETRFFILYVDLVLQLSKIYSAKVTLKTVMAGFKFDTFVT